ncbi:MAG: hypothetical protein ACFFCS_16010, partial [Candidatus Hodarchaeota archaeon]
MPDKAEKTKSVGLRLDEDMYNTLEELAEELNLNKTQVLLRAFNHFLMHNNTNLMSNSMVVSKKLFSEMITKLADETVKELAIDAGVSLANRFKLDMHKTSNGDSKEEMIKELLDYFETQGFNWFTETGSFLLENGRYKLQILHEFNEKMSLFFMVLFSEVMKEAFNLIFKE